jgi:gamma-D-glutamyl-L-lysine dipeptidyl-peptidase
MSERCLVAATMVWLSPDVIRDVDRPAVQDVPDLEAWVAGLAPGQRVDLQGRTETQLVRAEPVRILRSEGEWSQVVVPGQASSKCRDGYPGWVPSPHLGTGDDDLPGFLAPTGRVTPVAALEAARELLGTPYVWGGCGVAGVDCSGLVLAAHRALGVPVPRDAHDQMDAATPVPLTERRRGDLLFFAHPGRPAHHVGFDAGEGLLLHANMGEGTGVVECVPLSPDRADTLVAAGRFLPPEG